MILVIDNYDSFTYNLVQQFHPESILPVEGKRLLANFLGVPAPAVVAS